MALKRNVALGGGLLFTYALGIGVLFFLIAAFSMRLPKAGRWMQYIESLFGVLLVVAALYYLQPVAASLARYASPHAWFLGVNLALVVTGVLLGGIHLRYGSDMWTAVRKTVGVILLSAGLFGSLNYTTAPRGKLPWVKQEQVAKSRAKTAHKPLLIDFWAQWCLPCKQMEANVLSDPAVRRELTRFVLYKVDVTADSEEDRRKREKYQARQLPLLILFDSNGTERARIGKAIDPDTLLDLLRRVR